MLKWKLKDDLNNDCGESKHTYDLESYSIQNKKECPLRKYDWDPKDFLIVTPKPWLIIIQLLILLNAYKPYINTDSANSAW